MLEFKLFIARANGLAELGFKLLHSGIGLLGVVQVGVFAVERLKLHPLDAAGVVSRVDFRHVIIGRQGFYRLSRDVISRVSSALGAG